MDLLKRITTGIYLLTVQAGKTRAGMIVSWVLQISRDPLLVMAGVRPDRYTHKIMGERNSFGINILYEGQEELVDRMEKPLEERFEGVEFFTGSLGTPLLKDSIGAIECKIQRVIKPGDHSLFIGEVVGQHFLKDMPPLSSWGLGKLYLG